MRARADIHALFVKRFAVSSISNPASSRAPTTAELDAVEFALNARFPTSYREFVLCFGCVWTPHLADQIEVTGCAVPRAFEEFAPVGLLVAYDQWNTSIPQPLLLFAGDSLGDMIGFPKRTVEADDLPVVLFDHEFNEIIQLADSFDGLLSLYLEGGVAGSSRAARM